MISFSFLTLLLLGLTSGFNLLLSTLLLISQRRLQQQTKQDRADKQTHYEQLQQQHYSAKIRDEERYKALVELRESLQQLRHDQKESWHEQQSKQDRHQLNTLTTLQTSFQKNMADMRHQLHQTLTHNAALADKQLTRLTEQVDQRLALISGQVEKRLEKGFEKTTVLFTDVVKRLALIDQAQKEITKLSTNVVDLQEVLAGKDSRGTFGEVQLTALVKNMLPETQCQFQHTLSNGKRVDCLLFLPPPTGNIAIDAKFPLEGYRRLTNHSLSAQERKLAEQQFKLDIRRHIRDIAEKYIIPGETATGAMMFIPAEAVFAEIHANHPDIVEEAQKAKVWLASPTTMMAVLTTALAVLKDVATRKQVHIIQEHLGYLSKDFERFQARMNQLAKHIEQANNDVELVRKSSKKISSRFQKIGEVELTSEEVLL